VAEHLEDSTNVAADRGTNSEDHHDVKSRPAARLPLFAVVGPLVSEFEGLFGKGYDVGHNLRGKLVWITRPLAFGLYHFQNLPHLVSPKESRIESIPVPALEG